MAGHDIIVIGTSAGGVEALQALVSTLTADIPAAIFVVLHVSPHGTSVLPDILNRAGELPVSHAVDGQRFEYGHIYVAPPNFHLLVRDGSLNLSQRPKENGHRPSIDVLFRTAARLYGPRVVGVVMSGVLDDGSVGLSMIQAMGGIGIVQEPKDALYPSMPLNAIEANTPAYIAPAAEIAPILMRLAHERVEVEKVQPMPHEHDLAELNDANEPLTEPGGTPSTYVCPDCGGVMNEYHHGDLVRFRCQVGHAYSSESFIAEQNEQVENALWMALRTLDENVTLTRRLAERAGERGHRQTQVKFMERISEVEANAAILRQILLKGSIIATTED